MYVEVDFLLALHLVLSGDDPIVSSDSSYDPFLDRIRLEE